MLTNTEVQGGLVPLLQSDAVKEPSDIVGYWIIVIGADNHFYTTTNANRDQTVRVLSDYVAKIANQPATETQPGWIPGEVNVEAPPELPEGRSVE